MPKIAEVAAFIDTLAPFAKAEDWDNSGILVDCGNDVTAIIVALDITEEVVVEAETQGCQLIVAHHPVIFKPLKAMNRNTITYRMVKTNISAICAHTNLDAAPGGPSDVLAKLIGLDAATPFFGEMGRIGFLKETHDLDEFAKLCKTNLRAPVKYSDAGRPIKKVAVVAGAGKDALAEAVSLEADCLLTGEIDHHTAIDAKQAGISVIAAGHFETEYPALPVLAGKIARKYPGVRVAVSRRGKGPFTYL